jgi:hypothetical protein
MQFIKKHSQVCASNAKPTGTPIEESAAIESAMESFVACEHNLSCLLFTYNAENGKCNLYSTDIEHILEFEQGTSFFALFGDADCGVYAAVPTSAPTTVR